MRRAAPRWRLAAAALGLVLGSLAASLLLGEVLVRLTWRYSMPATERPPAVRPRDRAAVEVPADLPVYRGLWDLSQKNARGVFKGLPFRTNSAGFRGPETSAQPAPGTFRIVVGGDSVTMGSGVLEEEAYPARLQQLLDADTDGRRYEVLNLGLSGLNTRWVVQRIEAIGLSFHPDLIVYGFTLNDIEGPDYVSSITQEMIREKRSRYLRFVDARSYLLRAVWPRLLTLHELAFRPAGTLAHDYQYNYFENPAAWQAVTDGFDRLAELAEEADVCVHVLIHTGTAQLNKLFPFLGVMERVEQAARERGFSVTQTFPYFEGRDPTELRISFLDTHPNAAGHDILAAALRDGLRGLPQRCWR